MSETSWSDLTPEQKAELFRNPAFDVAIPILLCVTFVVAILILMTYIPKGPK